MRCPKCSNKLLQKSGSSTRVRLQGPLEFDAAGLAHSRCFWCNEPVVVPLSLKDSGKVEGERFVLKPTP